MMDPILEKYVLEAVELAAVAVVLIIGVWWSFREIDRRGSRRGRRGGGGG